MKDNQRLSFLLAGNSTYANRGCEAIVRGTAAIIRQCFDEPLFFSAYFAGPNCLDSRHESDLSIRHTPICPLRRFGGAWWQRQGLRLVHSPESPNAAYWHLRPWIERSLATLMVGGDNYTLDYGHPDRYFRLNDLVIRSGKPLVIWGASIGPFRQDPTYERQAANALRKATLICVRETGSLKYLQSLGVVDNVALVADPAFWLQPQPVELAPHIEKALTQGCVGLNLSPLLRSFTASQGLPAWLALAGEIVREVTADVAVPVLLTPHVTSETGEMAHDDYLFMQEISRRLALPADRLMLLPPTYNAAQTKWVISRMLAFAGARTHATLAALSSNVPTVLISYSMKSRGIGQDVYGHDEWLVPSEALQHPHLVAQRLSAVLKETSTVRRHLSAMTPVFRERALEAGRRLRSVLTMAPTP
jgi:colanic acid/amylovoran biosynthesis protein